MGIDMAGLAKEYESLEAQEADFQAKLGEVRGAMKMCRHLMGKLQHEKQQAAKDAAEANAAKEYAGANGEAAG